MAFQECPDVAEFTLRQLNHGEEIDNVIHVYKPTAWSAGNMDAVAGYIWGSVDTHLKTHLGDDWSMFQIAYRDLTTELGASGEYSLTPIVGTNASPCASNAVALCVTFRTSLRGRSFRGRVYQGGITVGAISEDAFDSGYVASIVADWTYIKTAITGVVGAALTVLSRSHNKAPRVQGAHYEVTTIQANTGIDSQRRRSSHPVTWVG